MIVENKVVSYFTLSLVFSCGKDPADAMLLVWGIQVEFTYALDTLAVVIIEFLLKFNIVCNCFLILKSKIATLLIYRHYHKIRRRFVSNWYIVAKFVTLSEFLVERSF